ncbi:DUF2484 family protein [Defluviimonas sp. WL0024]|uniref:DUF2484 family protein n=2 Tax=Albidovulum TaxID=205889 RepID=A0ABT3J6G0_9RHOB|nr:MULTISPECIES: DUF2484 family protein [Defluviimonas]MCU9849627.1 DUF2484 family protein [Defluviimonas sp. WL0024]MCW3783040.1 DUF2484 family protein [Defluviimonas salinarum]
MSLAVPLACLWVLVATGVAFLPMRYQILPGLLLLVAAATLVVWLAADTSPWIAVAALVAVVSMFRKPLRYLLKRIMERVAPDGEGREP